MIMLARFMSALMLAFGLGSNESAARPQQVAAEAAPPAWIDYAETATAILSNWLSSEDEAAVRVRAQINATSADPETPAPPLVVKLWVDPDGTLNRIEFAPFADPSLEAELRALLTARRLPPPPRGMLLPMRVALQIHVAPQRQPEPAAS